MIASLPVLNKGGTARSHSPEGPGSAEDLLGNHRDQASKPTDPDDRMADSIGGGAAPVQRLDAQRRLDRLSLP